MNQAGWRGSPREAQPKEKLDENRLVPWPARVHFVARGTLPDGRYGEKRVQKDHVA